MKAYDHKNIEGKWQKKWGKDKVYKTEDKTEKPKFYILDMFPYPSGEGLHVGHPKGYIATDIVSRMKRMQGFNVLHPMGFDAFGLPAENYAIKMKTNPMDSVGKNVAVFKKQLEIIGFDYDWSREINTTDPKYYKWTQWIFLKLLERGLAYESFEPINWCPSCKTGLANEDVEDGKCERCSTPVEKKPMRQWVLRITDYADRMLADLDATTYEVPKLVDKVNPHQEGKPLVKRKVAHAIVFDPKTKKYLIIRNKKHAWDTVIIGGIEGDETPTETAIREVREETGYIDIEFKRILGGMTEAHYYTKHKGENRIGLATAVYFELASDKRVPIGADEDKDNEVLWVDESHFVPGKMINSELPVWLERIKDPNKGWPKPLLDWPESIKEAQRNWIGRSEGAELDFEIRGKSKEVGGKKLTVFTTRPDTLFGVTYVVLAPEHQLVTELLKHKANLKNHDEVVKYVAHARMMTQIERTDAKKDKTGVRLEGVTAVNPANNEEVPVYVADYVLAEYGTGAVMAVPAHDERDFAFAKKYGLPVIQVIQKEASTKSYLMGADTISDDDLRKLSIKINERKIDGDRLLEIPEKSISAYETLITEKLTPGFWNEYVGKEIVFIFKDKNSAVTRIVLTKESERNIDALAARFRNEKPSSNLVWGWLADNKFYTGNIIHTELGILINSGRFSGRTSDESMKAITDSVGGRWVVKYKLKDWVFSRQRYWGEPFPILHDGKNIVPVALKDLPVELPKVKSYEPTGTGESPLADIEKWVNVKVGKGKDAKILKRETNTMPQWAGSSWYYLRYMDPKNDKALVDPAKEKYWNEVDFYVGGAEHATRHLIYARFWHKFLYDIGVVSTIEPFKRLQSVGLIMGEDGRKMSKRFGNVVNPDQIVETYGADTLRVYEMFMGPFDQAINWSTTSIVGSRRFLERVWKLAGKVGEGKDAPVSLPKETDALLHKTIKKVSEDIALLRHNTAVSSLMILSNELDKVESIPRAAYESFLKLLAPLAPHMTEELWANLGNKKSIHLSEWPIADESKCIDDTAKIMVQVNGKVRGSFDAPKNADKALLEKTALAIDDVKKWMGDKKPEKVIVVPGKLVSIVIR